MINNHLLSESFYILFETDYDLVIGESVVFRKGCFRLKDSWSILIPFSLFRVVDEFVLSHFYFRMSHEQNLVRLHIKPVF